MKRISVAIFLLTGSLVVAGCTSGRYMQYDRRHQMQSDTLSTMKKQDVISLSKAGVSDSLIITMMNVSNSWFQLKTQDVLDLKTAGVSDAVINAMVQTNAPMADSKTSDRNWYPYDYPPYYWWAGYYPYSYYPYWYYPSFYFGFNYYRPSVIHGYRYPHRTYFGNYGMRSSGRAAGRRR
jgi:hypothetical protein